MLVILRPTVTRSHRTSSYFPRISTWRQGLGSANTVNMECREAPLEHNGKSGCISSTLYTSVPYWMPMCRWRDRRTTRSPELRWASSPTEKTSSTYLKHIWSLDRHWWAFFILFPCFPRCQNWPKKQKSLSCASGDVTTPGSQGPGCNWTGVVKGRTRPTWWFVGTLRYSVGGFPSHSQPHGWWQRVHGWGLGSLVCGWAPGGWTVMGNGVSWYSI